jgi:hypothetical protein
MMNGETRTTKRGSLSAVRRVVTHTLILAALGLALGFSGLIPPLAATAQVEATEQPVVTEQTESTADVITPLPNAQPQSGDVQLQVGKTATLEGGALQVSMVQVSEDSRCPKDVMCVWMGRAVVRLHVVLDGVDRGDVDVTLYPGRRPQSAPDADATVDRYVISLVDLQPYPVAGNPQPLDQRVATIRVTAATP